MFVGFFVCFGFLIYVKFLIFLSFKNEKFLRFICGRRELEREREQERVQEEGRERQAYSPLSRDPPNVGLDPEILYEPKSRVRCLTN